MTESELRDQIYEHFNNSELNDLCFDLGIEYEIITGNTRKAKARELISYCHRHGIFDNLIEKCKSLRPHLGWERGDSKVEQKLPNIKELSLAEQFQIALNWAVNGRKESLYGFNLGGCVLWGVDFERADLRMTNLRNADLGRANLQKANLIGSDLRGASLFNAHLHGAKIDDTTKIDEKFRLVFDIIEVGGGVRNRNLEEVDLSNTILVWGELSYADLRNANLRGTTLVSANLTGANLTNADLRNADLSMSILRKSKLIKALLQNVNLQEADLSGADLRGANLTGAKLTWGDYTIDKMLPIKLAEAKFNDLTIWPREFDPQEWGAVYEG